MATHYSPSSRPLSEAASRVTALLDRYPAISDRELDELIERFPRLSILDVGLMSADERLSAKVAALHEAHGPRLKTPKTALIILLIAFMLVPAVTLAVFWLT